MTKDERFLVEIYRKANSDGTVDPFQVGYVLGFSDHITKNILKMLMKANFVKQNGSNTVSLTTRGRVVAKEMSF